LTARNREAGVKTVSQLRTAGWHVHFLDLDVSDETSIRSAAGEAVAAMDHLDVLVNNAGVYERDDVSVLTVTAATVLRTFTSNALGPVLVTQAFLPLLMKSQAPRVINVSSGGGSLHDMGDWAPAYSISKAALNAVTRQLAAALRDRGIA